jgi:hypothetical protein
MTSIFPPASSFAFGGSQAATPLTRGRFHDPAGRTFSEWTDDMRLGETFQAMRRETATDTRGVPASYTRAMTALAQPCALCAQRAVVADGSGIGLCAAHRREHEAAIAARRAVRARIDRARRERV